ncbi:MAG: DUF2283 domain-containing protein [Bacteriovoracaceae bacterium]
MKITYDKETDALYIAFAPTADIHITDEFKENLLVDYDEKEKMIGIEITNAKKTLGEDVVNQIVKGE